MSNKQHIVALGGGGFSMEDSPILDDYIVGLARQERPRICFLPTASGDNENYITRFYRRFSRANCVPTHLELFRRGGEDLDKFASEQDVIYVGGGNTANMLAVWRVHGVAQALRKALAGGTVLAGISAGSVCWFETGVTDSLGPELTRIDGLGFLPGSNCPHYDGESSRRSAYHRLIEQGMPDGFAADDGVALHFVGPVFCKAVSSRPNARAFRVERGPQGVRETTISVQYLGAVQPAVAADGASPRR